MLIFAGAGLGGVFRYLISLGLKTETNGFPISTFVVNVMGCLLIGFLFYAISAGKDELRSFLIIGILGGFTTFSSFGIEFINLYRSGQLKIGLWYAGLSNIAGFAAVYLGVKLSQWI